FARDLVLCIDRDVDIVADDAWGCVPIGAALLALALQASGFVAALVAARLLGGAAQGRVVAAAAIGRRAFRHLHLLADRAPAGLAAGHDRAGAGDGARVAQVEFALVGSDAA